MRKCQHPEWLSLQGFNIAGGLLDTCRQSQRKFNIVVLRLPPSSSREITLIPSNSRVVVRTRDSNRHTQRIVQHCLFNVFSRGAENGFKLVRNSMLELHLLERPLNSVCPESPPQIPRAVNSIQLHLIHRPIISSAPLIAPSLRFIMPNLCLQSHSSVSVI